MFQPWLELLLRALHTARSAHLVLEYLHPYLHMEFSKGDPDDEKKWIKSQRGARCVGYDGVTLNTKDVLHAPGWQPIQGVHRLFPREGHNFYTIGQRLYEYPYPELLYRSDEPIKDICIDPQGHLVILQGDIVRTRNAIHTPRKYTTRIHMLGGDLYTVSAGIIYDVKKRMVAQGVRHTAVIQPCYLVYTSWNVLYVLNTVTKQTYENQLGATIHNIQVHGNELRVYIADGTCRMWH